MAALEFTRRYAMAHRLLADPASKCAVPHGHNEIVSVRLEPARAFRFGGSNAEAPFEAVKGRWHAWIDDHVDHALQLGEDDPLLTYFRAHEPTRLARVLTVPGDPTTEALAACFWLKLSAFIEEYGLTDLVTWGVPPGMRPDQTTPSLERFARDVAPRLRARFGG